MPTGVGRLFSLTTSCLALSILRARVVDGVAPRGAAGAHSGRSARRPRYIRALAGGTHYRLSRAIWDQASFQPLPAEFNSSARRECRFESGPHPVRCPDDLGASRGHGNGRSRVKDPVARALWPNWQRRGWCTGRSCTFESCESHSSRPIGSRSIRGRHAAPARASRRI